MNKKIEGIDEEFQELGNTLSNLDFSNNTDKKKIYEKTLKNINRKEGIRMLKNKFKKASMAAAALAVLVTAANPTYAADMAKKMINSLTLGNVSFMEKTDLGVEPLEDCYKGKVFDENGNEVTSVDVNALYDNTQKLYTKDGKEIAYMARGEIVTVEEEEQKWTTIEDENKIKEYASFDYKLPEYIPEGYEFKEAKYKKHSGVTDEKTYYSEDLSLVYEDKNTGKNIYLEEYSSEQPFAVMTNKDMEQIKVNDIDAVVFNNGSIGWAINDVSYNIGSQDINQDELLKIAESIK